MQVAIVKRIWRDCQSQWHCKGTVQLLLVIRSRGSTCESE